MNTAERVARKSLHVASLLDEAEKRGWRKGNKDGQATVAHRLGEAQELAHAHGFVGLAHDLEALHKAAKGTET